jgi:hypothetical protein
MRLRAVISGEEAIYYLGGDGIFSDRTRFPIPKVTLLDVKDAWSVGICSFGMDQFTASGGRAVVVMMTSSKQPQDVYKLGDFSAW